MNMSHVMRIPTSCKCDNKGEDQLLGLSAADQPLVFTKHYNVANTIFHLPSKLLAICLPCTARFLSDLVGNPEDSVFYDTAHI